MSISSKAVDLSQPFPFWASLLIRVGLFILTTIQTCVRDSIHSHLLAGVCKVGFLLYLLLACAVTKVESQSRSCRLCFQRPLHWWELHPLSHQVVKEIVIIPLPRVRLCAINSSKYKTYRERVALKTGCLHRPVWLSPVSFVLSQTWVQRPLPALVPLARLVSFASQRTQTNPPR